MKEKDMTYNYYVHQGHVSHCHCCPAHWNRIWCFLQKAFSPRVNLSTPLWTTFNWSTLRRILTTLKVSFLASRFFTNSFCFLFSGVSFPKGEKGSMSFQSCRRSLMSSTFKVTRFVCQDKEYLIVSNVLCEGTYAISKKLVNNTSVAIWRAIMMSHSTWYPGITERPKGTMTLLLLSISSYRI